MGKQYNLSLVIDAATAKAMTKIRGLETALGKVGAGGGLKGLSAGGLGLGLSGLRLGIGGIGGALSSVTSLAGGFLSVGRMAFSALLAPVRMLASAISSIVGGAIKGVGILLKGMAVGFGAAVGAVYGAVKAMAPAGFLEGANIQMETLLGSADKARQRMAWLKDFETKTPFDLKQLVTAANLMESFGVYSERSLKAFGNAASAFGQQITEVVGPMTKLKQGMFDSRSLGAFGITREALAGEGVQFGAGGDLQTPGLEAYDAALRYMEKRFDGLMDRQAKSWNGLLSTMSSRWFTLWGNLGQGALRYGKGALDEIIKGFDFLNAKALEVDWSGIGEKLVKGFATARQIMFDLFDQAKRQEMVGAAKETLSLLPKALGDVGRALVKDIGATLGNVLANIKPIGAWLMDGLQGAFRFGVSLFGEMWSAMGKETSDRIRLAMHYGTEAFARLNPQTWAAFKLFGKNETATQFEAASARSKELTSMDVAAGRLSVSDTAGQQAAQKRHLDSLMGWGGAGTSVGLGTAAGEADRQKNWLGQGLDFGKVIVSTDNTAAALKELPLALQPFTSYVSGAAERSGGGMAPAPAMTLDQAWGFKPAVESNSLRPPAWLTTPASPSVSADNPLFGTAARSDMLEEWNKKAARRSALTTLDQAWDDGPATGGVATGAGASLAASANDPLLGEAKRQTDAASKSRDYLAQLLVKFDRLEEGQRAHTDLLASLIGATA